MRVNVHLASLVLSSTRLGMRPCAFAADKLVHSVEELDDTLWGQATNAQMSWFSGGG